MRSRESTHKEALIQDLALAIKEIARKVNLGTISAEDLFNELKEALQPIPKTEQGIEVEERKGITMPEDGTPVIREAFLELQNVLTAATFKTGKLVKQVKFEEYLQFMGDLSEAVTSGRLGADFFRNIKSIN